MRRLIATLLGSLALCMTVPVLAAPTLLLSAQIRATDPTLVDLVVRVEGLGSDGLAAAHLDFNFDSPAVSLVSATAGDFFSTNAGGGSLWTDTASGGLSEGDSVLTTVTDATTGPDTIGFDLLEVLGFASFADGVLLNLVFDIGSAGAATFRTNDGLLVDAVGTPTFLAASTLTAGSPGTVPEPGALALALMALTTLAGSRKASRSKESE